MNINCCCSDQTSRRKAYLELLESSFGLKRLALLDLDDSLLNAILHDESQHVHFALLVETMDAIHSLSFHSFVRQLKRPVQCQLKRPLNCTLEGV